MYLKDSKISSMERGLRDLEEEIQMLKSNGALSTEEREEEIKQMEVYRSHSKFMKNKVITKQCMLKKIAYNSPQKLMHSVNHRTGKRLVIYLLYQNSFKLSESA